MTMATMSGIVMVALTPMNHAKSHSTPATPITIQAAMPTASSHPGSISVPVFESC